MSDVDALKAQHRADGERLTKGPDLLAAARRAHTLLVNLEADTGEYYRETKWLEASIASAEGSVLLNGGGVSGMWARTIRYWPTRTLLVVLTRHMRPTDGTSRPTTKGQDTK